MSRRKTFKEVKKYIEEHQGILLSTSYINQSEPLQLKCPHCNDVYYKTFKQIQRSSKPLKCSQCNKKDVTDNQKYTEKYLKTLAESKGFKLLSDYSDYINRDSLLNLRCFNCNEEIKLTAHSLKNKKGKFCNSCSYKESNGRRRLQYNDIRRYIDNTETTLIDVNFDTHPPNLTLKCSCGELFIVKSKDFKNFIYNVKHQLCPKCVNNICHCGISTIEFEVLDYLKTLTDEDIIKGDRTLLKGSEIDFYIPSKKLGIEIDGVYWHSELSGKKDNQYHLNKTLQCNKEDVKLLHFFDNEWNEKTNIVKSMISTNFNLNKKIYARKCTIETISSKDANEFHSNNHIQGSINSSIHYGLKYERKLVCLMSFSKSRFSKKSDYELTRFSSLLYTTVVGGASRLLKSFLRDYDNPIIVSYADRRYSEGNLYKVLGFNEESVNKPNYTYVYNGKMYSRLKFQKKNLKRILKFYDSEMTEWENMMNNGYDRIWNCGTITYIL